jgi:ABC-type branched-subunit amino acid transport system ATPase component
MILFKKMTYKNILSTGNTPNVIEFNTAKTTLLVGKNGEGKCFYINTPIRVRNTKTGETLDMTVGEFYESQKKQNKRREDN